MSALALQLARGLDELSLDLDAVCQSQLLEYLALMTKWNKVYNLTAIKTSDEMIAKHLLDSLAVIPHLRGQRFVDVGTGAGLPGIPLALAMPDATLTLLDSSGKRLRFLQQVCQQLGLKNVYLQESRVEQYHPSLLFDGVISRAFAKLDKFLTMTQALCAQEGCFWAMKAVLTPAEVDKVPDTFVICQTIELQIPGVAAPRHLLCLRAR